VQEAGGALERGRLAGRGAARAAAAQADSGRRWRAAAAAGGGVEPAGAVQAGHGGGSARACERGPAQALEQSASGSAGGVRERLCEQLAQARHVRIRVGCAGAEQARHARDRWRAGAEWRWRHA
jgi:hypothetical protein